MSAIALIPARGGSVRIPKKNIKLLNGHPLIAYTIRAALESDCFEKVLVSSDDTETLRISSEYGADVVRRPEEYATATSPDVEWVRHALTAASKVQDFDTFSILRPTSPFRLPSTIQRAMLQWQNGHARGGHYSSLRAVSPVSEHPGKAWQLVGERLVPVLLQPPGQPFHDSQLASLPPVFVQNASLEIAWAATVWETGTISGPSVMGFLSEGYEGWDVNTERDWLVAEQMVRDGVELPNVS